MDDLKLFAKNKNQIDSLVNTVKIFSEDIKMEFGLPKYGVLIMKWGKVVKSEGISMPNGNMVKNSGRWIQISWNFGGRWCKAWRGERPNKDRVHQKNEKYTKVKDMEQES